jgi:Rrf2 family protein
MIDLAQQDSEAYIPLKDIAERQDISKKYLEIIVKELVKGGLVTGVSGKGGGYKLTRKPEEYSIGEIIEMLEGSLAPVACLADGAKDCPREKICKTLPMWTEFYLLERDFFYGKKLSDLVNS